MISISLSLKCDFESICVMIHREYAQAQPGLLVQLNVLISLLDITLAKIEGQYFFQDSRHRTA